MNPLKNLVSKLTIVIPTLNEAGNIEILVRRILQVLPKAQIVVVDDGSEDGTLQIVKELQKTFSGLRFIDRSPYPKCLTDSIAAGVSGCDTEFVAWMDADLSHPPELLLDLLAKGQSTGCAIASRFIAGGGQKKADKDTPDSPLAIILSTIMNVLVRSWLRIPINDFTSGYIVCRTSYLKNHQFLGDYGEYFLELMYYLSKNKIVIAEIPFVSPPRKHGESKTGTTLWKLGKRGIKYIAMAVRLKFYKVPELPNTSI